MPLDAATPWSPRGGHRPTMLEISARAGAYMDEHFDVLARKVAHPVRPASPTMALPHRRFLSITEAAEYVGVSVSTFREEVVAGKWPGPDRRGKTGRALTWDVRALDFAADLAAGISAMGSAVIKNDDVSIGEAALLKRFSDGAPKVDRLKPGPEKGQKR